MIKIQVLPGESYMLMSVDKPREGGVYILDDATNGTLLQNALFHALIDCFYDWMLSTNTFVFELDGAVYSFACANKHELKQIIKRDYGEGYDYWCYSTDDFEVVFVDSVEKIPEQIVDLFEQGKKHLIKRHLKSWTKYTLKQRRKLTDKLKTLMIMCRVDSKKFDEIMEGLCDREK